MDDNFDMQFNSIPFSVHNGGNTKEKICLWQLTQAFKITFACVVWVLLLSCKLVMHVTVYIYPEYEILH